jgi:hypothetical protein
MYVDDDCIVSSFNIYFLTNLSTSFHNEITYDTEIQLKAKKFTNLWNVRQNVVVNLPK